jgi:hypothetical protein
MRKLAECGIIASQKPRRNALVAQIPFDFAQGRLSRRKERFVRNDETELRHSRPMLYNHRFPGQRTKTIQDS